jgi:type II secretory pathway pseudopilin PulG
MKHMTRTKGFTTIEVLVVLVLLLLGGWLFFSQKASFDAAARDSDRKVAINAMYYSLEEVYYQKNGYYPATIDSKTLRSVDPALFADPDGNKLGEQGSDYDYRPTNCSLDGQCKSYTLSAALEREADYEKTSRHE